MRTEVSIWTLSGLAFLDVTSLDSILISLKKKFGLPLETFLQKRFPIPMVSLDSSTNLLGLS
jgi:hypothetical protein